METQEKTIGQAESRPESFAGRPIHLIGIGGSGMRALGRMLMDRQAVVSGSDMCPSAGLEALVTSGCDLHGALR